MSEYILNLAQEFVENYPDALREEIVRCRDCRYYSHYQDLCERLQPGMLVLEPDDGFCAWGERKVVGE